MANHWELEPLEGVNGREPTAFTKKTIKELLAEAGPEANDTPLMTSKEDAPKARTRTADAPDAISTPKPKRQQAAPSKDDLRRSFTDEASPFQKLEPAEPSAERPKKGLGLLGRLLGKKA